MEAWNIMEHWALPTVGNPCFSWYFQLLWSSGCCLVQVLAFHWVLQTHAANASADRRPGVLVLYPMFYLFIGSKLSNLFTLTFVFYLIWPDLISLSHLSRLCYVSYLHYLTNLSPVYSNLSNLIVSFFHLYNPFYSIHQSPTYSLHVSSSFLNVHWIWFIPWNFRSWKLWKFPSVLK